ncbi:MAG: hypothetical protein IM653_02465 [Phenylobacterium sp.]|uniref:SO2930 family diheme c-type cytochrome n=1 Tax=Phenylobacterium sp. TaxID=1871053 RepID=UPI0025DA4765|nr:SO2930 family diheme c-type cytochrome [Phenylobacterium sp.]MCA6223345.1 hypothetical protein [Phenylobacterium sp.]MCA6226033.1 hypothetical protein [Phenylobacterium sp.]MCA6232075.1 hypothetical protein [Phenylobacterium sp.]MCA6233976.1 hypothetical protein [Phenylobacterium sp.]MCA6249502.1 hypothetical protein [Phenylobacterium sp.]
MRRGLVLLAALTVLGAASSPPGVDLDLVLQEAPAQRLSDYRLFVDASADRPNGRVVPYTLATPLFTDHAEKSRLVFTPPGARIGYTATGVLDFPVGAVLVKTFAYPADLRRPDRDVRKVETRLLIHKASGWTAQTYVWNAEGTEAVLRRAGARLPVRFTDSRGREVALDYAVPNQNQCKTCHQVDGAVAPIGPKARNLNHEIALAGGGRTNQLERWRRAGLLDGAPPPAARPHLAAWDDPRQSLDARARAYLDVNCAHCHSPSGSASNSGLFLTAEETRPAALGVGKPPVAAGRGAGDLAVGIEPGHPGRSILAFRMASGEPGVMMPELGRALIHEEGVALISAWIGEMAPKAKTAGRH